jgi:hypothetical protein
MVALAVLRRQHVIAQAEEITLTLSLEAESMQRFLHAAGEQMQGISFSLGLDELPHGPNLHELRHLAFHFLHALAYRPFHACRVEGCEISKFSPGWCLLFI